MDISKLHRDIQMLLDTEDGQSTLDDWKNNRLHPSDWAALYAAAKYYQCEEMLHRLASNSTYQTYRKHLALSKSSDPKIRRWRHDQSLSGRILRTHILCALPTHLFETSDVFASILCEGDTDSRYFTFIVNVRYGLGSYIPSCALLMQLHQDFPRGVRNMLQYILCFTQCGDDALQLYRSLYPKSRFLDGSLNAMFTPKGSRTPVPADELDEWYCNTLYYMSTYEFRGKIRSHIHKNTQDLVLADKLPSKVSGFLDYFVPYLYMSLENRVHGRSPNIFAREVLRCVVAPSAYLLNLYIVRWMIDHKMYVCSRGLTQHLLDVEENYATDSGDTLSSSDDSKTERLKLLSTLWEYNLRTNVNQVHPTTIGIVLTKYLADAGSDYPPNFHTIEKRANSARSVLSTTSDTLTTSSHQV